VHISQISDRFVKDPREAVNPGDQVKVKVLEVNQEKNQISLTMKGLSEKADKTRSRNRQNDGPRDSHEPRAKRAAKPPREPKRPVGARAEARIPTDPNQPVAIAVPAPAPRTPHVPQTPRELLPKPRDPNAPLPSRTSSRAPMPDKAPRPAPMPKNNPFGALAALRKDLKPKS
jgi:hypothetical protein